MRGNYPFPACDLAPLLLLDAETGELTWKERSAEQMKSGKIGEAKRWNGRHAYKTAFTAINNGGYKSGAVHGLPLMAHIVVWALHHGEWPTGYIDHINGDRLDNRPINLRAATPSDNAKNRSLSSNSSSRVTGVSYSKRDRVWVAHIGCGGRHISLGNFKNMSDAINARKSAEQKFDFHPNHGRFQK